MIVTKSMSSLIIPTAPLVYIAIFADQEIVSDVAPAFNKEYFLFKLGR